MVLGVPNNRLTFMQDQKHFSYNMHLFLPYLLNDSQTIRSTIHFSKLLLCVTLICADWWISYKAVFVSAVLLCTALPRKQIFLLLQNQHLVAKNEFAFSFRPMRKHQQVGGNMLMFDVNMKRLGIRFKNDSFF